MSRYYHNYEGSYNNNFNMNYKYARQIKDFSNKPINNPNENYNKISYKENSNNYNYYQVKKNETLKTHNQHPIPQEFQYNCNENNNEKQKHDVYNNLENEVENNQTNKYNLPYNLSDKHYFQKQDYYYNDRNNFENTTSKIKYNKLLRTKDIKNKDSLQQKFNKGKNELKKVLSKSSQLKTNKFLVDFSELLVDKKSDLPNANENNDFPTPDKIIDIYRNIGQSIGKKFDLSNFFNYKFYNLKTETNEQTMPEKIINSEQEVEGVIKKDSDSKHVMNKKWNIIFYINSKEIVLGIYDSSIVYNFLSQLMFFLDGNQNIDESRILIQDSGTDIFYLPKHLHDILKKACSNFNKENPDKTEPKLLASIFHKAYMLSKLFVANIELLQLSQKKEKEEKGKKILITNSVKNKNEESYFKNEYN